MSTAEIIAKLEHLSSAELAQVQAKIRELVIPACKETQIPSAASHPALGIWKNRTDLPDDAIEASKLLREKMARQSDSATQTTAK